MNTVVIRDVKHLLVDNRLLKRSSITVQNNRYVVNSSTMLMAADNECSVVHGISGGGI